MWSCARSIKQVSCMCAQAAMDADERETCWGALDVLRGCSAGMVYHDLQQHCCIPFHALEGMDCLWCARQSSPCTQPNFLESYRVHSVDTKRLKLDSIEFSAQQNRTLFQTPYGRLSSLSSLAQTMINPCRGICLLSPPCVS